MGILGIIKSMFGNSTDYNALINNGAVVVDVRTPGEFQSGHVKGSQNIPLDVLPQKVSQLKGKEVILVCRSGGRAMRAKSILQNNGITAHNAGAWQNIKN